MMASATSIKRTPRACERCRQSRRRCETPYPCRQCVAAGITCDVRAKARPRRSRQCRQTVLKSQNDRPGAGSSHIDGPSNVLAKKSDAQLTAGVRIGRYSDTTARKVTGDTFDLLKTLVQDILLDRHGYTISCTLAEPTSSDTKVGSSSSATFTPTVGHLPLPLSAAQLWSLLADFEKFMGWQDAELVNIEDMHAMSLTFIEYISNETPPLVSKNLTSRGLPIDSIALILSALALGAVAIGQFDRGRFYFDTSTEVIKHFVGQSTLELCLAFFLQHVFALRVGTLNYAQAVVAQAIQSAHDLGLHHNAGGIPGLQLYLLIYMADQYCSLTHNTEPIIQTAKIQSQTFTPLSEAKPELRALIDLVTINGYVIEHSHRLQVPSQTEVLELESRISTLCSRPIMSIPVQSTCEGFKRAYEPLARVHMLCCRLRLRAPGLSELAFWLPSLCVCVHAAEEVLSAYFQLYRPMLDALIKQRSARGSWPDKSSTLVACMLAPTWRQVKRIMMSAFVVIFAYSHGEMMQEEASRYTAMARLLLEYPRWRWGEKLDEALQTLVDISKLSSFKLYAHTEKLLPGADEQALTHSHSLPQFETESFAAVGNFAADPAELHDEALFGSAQWDSIPDTAPIEGSLWADVNMFQTPALLGLWETA